MTSTRLGHRVPPRPLAAAVRGGAIRRAGSASPAAASRTSSVLTLVVGLVDEQVVQPAAGHHVLPQRHRSVLLDDDGGVAAHGHEPVAELLGVAHCRRQRHQPHRLGEVDDHLLPDRAAEAVGEVVHLVHDDVAEPAQGVRPGVEHVAQHLGRHDDDGRLGVDGVVAGEQTDRRGAVAAHQVGVLLVGQRLDRCRVEALAALGQREVHRELADDRLARAGRRGDQHPVTRLERLARAHLEGVETEGVERRRTASARDSACRAREAA